MRRWLALSDAAWREVFPRRLAESGRRAYDAAALEHALGYPWERPAGSFVLRDGMVEELATMSPPARDEVAAAFVRDRHPLVAFGANGAPSRLRARFAAFDDAADRAALVLTGKLHGVDVCAQASPTAFGTVPGVMIASPGTAVRASVLWLTAPQLAEVAYAELGYRFGRLDRIHFVADESEAAIDDLFAFVSRIGALSVDGEPVALAAIPATGRRLRAMTQEELLDRMAGLVLGDASAHAGDIVRMCFEDAPALVARLAPLTWPTAVRLPADHWTPYPGP